jgi:hypothetical protein
LSLAEIQVADNGQRPTTLQYLAEN